MRKIAIFLVSFVVTLGILPVTAVPVRAAYNAECDNLQLSDNTWVVRDSYTTSPNWASRVSAFISRYSYAMCSHTPILRPEATGWGAWVAIEGPYESGLMGGNSIIQVGYWKCEDSDACTVSGIPSSHWGEVVYFYAFGNANDVFHQPFSQYLGVATTNSTFDLRLAYPSSGGRRWEFRIDGTLVRTLDDEWRTWNRGKIQVGAEIWNEGDQIGGRPPSGSDAGNKQKFRDVFWVGGTTHTGLSSVIYQTGHCYSWAHWSATDSANWDVWTSNNHTNC